MMGPARTSFCVTEQALVHAPHVFCSATALKVSALHGTHVASFSLVPVHHVERGCREGVFRRINGCIWGV